MNLMAPNKRSKSERVAILRISGGGAVTLLNLDEVLSSHQVQRQIAAANRLAKISKR